MQTKMTMKCCIIFTRMSIIKSKRTQNNKKNRKADNKEKWTLPYSNGGNVKRYTSCRKQSHSPSES